MRECEVVSVRVRSPDAAWLVRVLRGCGVPLTTLIQLYHSLHRAQDPVWQVRFRGLLADSVPGSHRVVIVHANL